MLSTMICAVLAVLSTGREGILAKERDDVEGEPFAARADDCRVVRKAWHKEDDVEDVVTRMKIAAKPIIDVKSWFFLDVQ